MRRCLDCGTDISKRGNRAMRCAACSIERNRKARIASAQAYYQRVKGEEWHRERNRRNVRRYKRLKREEVKEEV